MAMNESFQFMFLQNQINQLQNQINQMAVNPNNQMQFNNIQMQIINLQNQLNMLRAQQINQINNFNQMNNIGMNFNHLNNMCNLNNNINNINQSQQILINNNLPMQYPPIGIPQNGFFPVFSPNQNFIKEENVYIVCFNFTSGKYITCYVSADKSIKEMIQILENKVLMNFRNSNDIYFIFNSQKIDINSEEKIKELFGVIHNPKIVVDEINPSIEITFNSSSGAKTIVKYCGCLCCTRFWDLLKVYLDKIGLDENCLKDLKFLFNGNTLPNSKNEAMKYSSAKYGIQAGSIIMVVDPKNIIGKK